MTKSACGHKVVGEEFEKRKHPFSAVIDIKIKCKKGLSDTEERTNLHKRRHYFEAVLLGNRKSMNRDLVI